MMIREPRHSNMERIDMKARPGLVNLFVVAILGIGGSRTFGEDVKPVELVKPTPNTADEPLAKEFTLARTAAFLDAGSLWWTRERIAARVTPISPI
jgi:hypothetical protein